MRSWSRTPRWRVCRRLTAAIGAFIDHWNDHPIPFTWTKNSDEILANIKSAQTKTSGLTDH